MTEIDTIDKEKKYCVVYVDQNNDGESVFVFQTEGSPREWIEVAESVYLNDIL